MWQIYGNRSSDSFQIVSRLDAGLFDLQLTFRFEGREAALSMGNLSRVSAAACTRPLGSCKSQVDHANDAVHIFCGAGGHCIFYRVCLHVLDLPGLLLRSIANLINVDRYGPASPRRSVPVHKRRHVPRKPGTIGQGVGVSCHGSLLMFDNSVCIVVAVRD